MAALKIMATCGLLQVLVNDCCKTPLKVNSSPMAGIRAMITKLHSHPPKECTSSICLVNSSARSSIDFMGLSIEAKALGRCRFPFHVVSWPISGMDMNIIATPTKRLV